jgi:hypothetical protein
MEVHQPANSGVAERFQKWGSGFRGLGDFVRQKLTHFCKTNIIFWQPLAEQIAVCSDNYTNNMGVARNYVLGGPVERQRRELEAPKVPRGWSAGRRVHPPLGRAIHPPQKSFEFFVWKMCLYQCKKT